VQSRYPDNSTKEPVVKITVAVARSLEIFLLVLGCAACTASATDLSQPVTLVASASLGSSGFSETVLFAAPLPNGMHIGFIVNRPTEVALAKAFPEHVPSGKVVDPLYFGGPVLADLVFAVVPTPPEDTEDLLQLMPGVVLVMDGKAVDRIIETTPNDARYFAGLIVWEPGELDEEIRAGAWDVVPADASAVFSTHPETLWKTLSRGGPRLEARSGQTQPSAREIGFTATASAGAPA
jgi:putative transcriptional regulator